MFLAGFYSSEVESSVQVREQLAGEFGKEKVEELKDKIKELTKEAIDNLETEE